MGGHAGNHRGSGTPAAVEAWHHVVATADRQALRRLLADDVVFRSPAVHTPQEGADRAYAYLSAALTVLGPTLSYRRQWIDGGSAVLEFTAVVDGLQAHGVDMLRWDESGQLLEFTVMVRPSKALTRLVGLMGRELETER